MTDYARVPGPLRELAAWLESRFPRRVEIAEVDFENAVGTVAVRARPVNPAAVPLEITFIAGTFELYLPAAYDTEQSDYRLGTSEAIRWVQERVLDVADHGGGQYEVRWGPLGAFTKTVTAFGRDRPTGVLIRSWEPW